MEIRDIRCCMCPNIGTDKMTCPAGPLKDNETQCNFAIAWSDARGWKYRVMGDLAGTYKGRYQKDAHSGGNGWKGMRQLGRRDTFDQAQEDLNCLAILKGWKPIVG